ncbi:uncharacterized protein LOC144164256 isoform X2 [Haemaphysalis longicornis]
MTRWTPRVRPAERHRRQNRPARIASVLTLMAAIVTIVFWTHSLLQFSRILAVQGAEEQADVILTLHEEEPSRTPATTFVRERLSSLTEASVTSPRSSTIGHFETFKEQPSVGGDWVSTDAYPRTKLRLFLYSAYLDSRLDVPAVRVIGAYASVGGAQISCRLEYASGDVTIVAASRKTINENWKLKYGAAFFNCPYQENDSRSPAPSRVRLKETYELQWSPSIPVLPLQTRPGEKKGRLAVCVKPLHYEYDRASWLAEFVEFHRIVGVEHFFFYNHSIGSNAERLLQVYKEQGVVTSRPWNLDIKSPCNAPCGAGGCPPASLPNLRVRGLRLCSPAVPCGPHCAPLQRISSGASQQRLLSSIPAHGRKVSESSKTWKPLVEIKAKK